MRKRSPLLSPPLAWASALPRPKPLAQRVPRPDASCTRIPTPPSPSIGRARPARRSLCASRMRWFGQAGPSVRRRPGSRCRHPGPRLRHRCAGRAQADRLVEARFREQFRRPTPRPSFSWCARQPEASIGIGATWPGVGVITPNPGLRRRPLELPRRLGLALKQTRPATNRRPRLVRGHFQKRAGARFGARGFDHHLRRTRPGRRCWSPGRMKASWR